MIDVSGKYPTLRTAVAEASVRIPEEILDLVREGRVPKGDVFELSRVAATMAAKRTSELIPYCHPVPIDVVNVEFQIRDEAMAIRAVVASVWKTGVEMEAMTAATMAALNVYDMLKPLTSEIVIEKIQLVEKKGGKSEFLERPKRDLKAAVLVVSDSCFSGEREDKSGKKAKELLESYPIRVECLEILPDDFEKIREKLVELSEKDFDLVLTTGGTGIGPKDLTVDATKKVIDKEIPGASLALSAFGLERTRLSMFSRQTVGLRGKTLFINLPGSERAVSEGISALFPHLLHYFPMVRGKGHGG